MDYNWIEEYVKTKPGVTTNYKTEWEMHRHYVGNKMFGMRGYYKDNRPILTLKLEPAFGELLRSKYDYIIPGYYMNKTHYNTIFLDRKATDEELKDYLDKSYDIAFKSLTKKLQKEIHDTAE